MYRPQSLLAHVSVQLGGGKIAVPQQFLYCPQVGTAVEQVGGVGVPQCVGVGRARRSPVEDAADVPRGESFSSLVQEEGLSR